MSNVLRYRFSLAPGSETVGTPSRQEQSRIVLHALEETLLFDE